MKKMLMILTVFAAQNAFAINAFDIKCELPGNKLLMLEHYIVLPGRHGDSGTILDQARVYNATTDQNEREAIMVREESFNSPDGSFTLVVKTDSLEAVAVVPGLVERISDSHAGLVSAKGSIGGTEIDLDQQACRVFLN